MRTRARSLTPYQAAACELALTSACGCRCGGTLHGAKRVGLGLDPEPYYLLPAADPHHVDPSSRGWQLAFFEPNSVALIQRLLDLDSTTSTVGTVRDAHVRPEEVVQ